MRLMKSAWSVHPFSSSVPLEEGADVTAGR
jgi:hypothetical protein